MANYASNIEQYIKNIQTDILPASDLAMYQANRNGLVFLDINSAMPWNLQLPNSVEAGLYKHEKSSTTRMGVLAKHGNPHNNQIFHSYYSKPFYGGMKIWDNLIAQSILELYPTPIQTYGTVTETNSISGSVIDLNHLRTKEGHLPVQAVRFDMMLHTLGLGKEINSFMDLQNFINNENTKKLFSERAIVQLGLCTYFIPNAVGEVDANSRNIIILNDPNTGKFEYCARIDAESNTYFNDINNERSGKKVLPKGIFHGNEYFETEFLKAINEKDSSVDWKLFASFTNLANTLTSRNHIDNAIFNGYRRNYGRAPISEYDVLYHANGFSPVEKLFGFEAYSDFSNATIDRAKRYHDAVFSALKSYPSNNNVPFENMETSKPTKLEQCPFNAKGEPLNIEEEMELGL